MVAMMEEYREDCKNDLDLKSYDDKCRTCFERITMTTGEGGLNVDQMKEGISSVREMNKCILDKLIGDEDKIVKLMGGKEERQLVNQYFSITSEMLDFCCKLDRFVLSARTSHSYISHVIGQLQMIHEDENGYRRIMEVLEKLKTSNMVSGNESAESLLQSIASLLKMFNDMNVALERYKDKREKKLKSIRTWRLITNMMFIGLAVCAVIFGVWYFSLHPHLSVSAKGIVAAVLKQPDIPAARATIEANSHELGKLAIGGLIEAVVPVIELGKHWALSWFKQAEIKIQKQQAVGNMMTKTADIAIKELGDIRFLINDLVNYIDSSLEAGKIDMGFAMTAIKNNLRIFLEKIEELDKEKKRCITEIRKARDDVLDVVKKEK